MRHRKCRACMTLANPTQARRSNTPSVMIGPAARSETGVSQFTVPDAA
jgi:hypothetical protein